MLYRSRCLPLGRAVDISFSVLSHQRRQSQSINSIGTNKIQYDRHGGRRTLTTIGQIDESTIRKAEPQSPVLPTRSLGLTLSGENSLLQTESRRFQELSQQLFSISEHVDCGSHWRSAARILVELRGLSLKSTAADPMDLTLDHFHAVFRTLLQACNKHSGMRYPDRMLASTWSGELVTCCMGITHDSDGIGYTRRSWRPNFNFYTRLIHRLEEHFHPRADMSMDGHSLTPLLGEVYTQENIWLLAMSLEAYRGSKEIDAETEEEDFEGNQGEALTSTSSPRDMPSLSLVRNLFAAIEEFDLEPARETVNYILAIFESHSRAISAADEWTSQAELESAALTGGESQVESTTSPSSSSEMDFLWRLWTDMDRIMHIHPDLLSLVLMIRLCFHHKRYRYLARILSDHDASTCLLESAQSILCGHQFAEPNLMMSALTHRSRVALRTDSNERMEFLGDSVLDVLVREAILRKVGLSNDSNNPNSFEKDLLPTQRLARIKGKFVSHSHLCALAREVGLSNLLLAANKNRGSGWFGNRNQSCLSPRSAQARPSKQLPENGSDMNVSDSLAEDVLEACIAALFLDKPDHAPPNRHKDDTITTPDIPIQQSSSDISSSRNLIHQPFGYSAARQFFNLLMGPQLEKACEQACQAHRHRNRSDTGGNTDNRHTAVFQKHLNYKHLLDLWVRSIYTDDAGVCHARVLYVLHGILGAHTHRVRVIVKVLPSGEVDRNRVRQPHHGESMNEIFANSQKKFHGQSYMNFLEAQERRRPGGTAPFSIDTASSSTISFSVSPNYIPPLNPAYDRVFSAISETPELSTAEHRAAFTALQEWGAIRSGNKRKRRN